MPAPVCSCTGKYQQCYKWGDGGWQSACCTTRLSMYPLPVLPNKRHARLGGRKMSGSVFTKLLSRLAADGCDLSVPVDLKDHWAKHGTNRYVTIKWSKVLVSFKYLTFVLRSRNTGLVVSCRNFCAVFPCCGHVGQCITKELSSEKIIIIENWTVALLTMLRMYNCTFVPLPEWSMYIIFYAQCAVCSGHVICVYSVGTFYDTPNVIFFLRWKMSLLSVPLLEFLSQQVLLDLH